MVNVLLTIVITWWVQYRWRNAPHWTLLLFPPEGDEKRIGSFMNMSYACDDIEKTYKELSARGVEFEGPPQKQPWGTYAMFKDSEGKRFVVSSYSAVLTSCGVSCALCR
jgi:hypothetical protein